MKNERSIVSITSENYEGTRPERRRQAKSYLYAKELKERKETLFSGITRAMRRLMKKGKWYERTTKNVFILNWIWLSDI